MNKLFIILSLLASTTQAQSLPDNIYVTANIEQHIPEFVAMEITKDIRASIIEYNQNRKNPEFFAAKITDPKVLKLFQEATKKVALPEIKQKDELHWMVKAGKDTIEFSAELFLKRKYFLNGKERILKSDDLMASHSSATFKYSLVKWLMSDAVADDDEELKASYLNLNTTKILMASIIALDTSFKQRGMMDKIPMMNDVADSNAKNLVKKIEAYTNQCEGNLQAQESMMRGPNSNFDDLGTLDRYSMMRSLQDASDPAYQQTLALVRKMAAENAASSSEREKKLEATFNTEKKPTCEAMLANVFEESKDKTNKIAYWIDGGNSAKQAAANHPCTKMAKLKLCLSKFTTRATSINDFARKYRGDAKAAGVQIYDVPQNFPSENTSR